jgi:DNA-binding CsgD family transcriptional regulator
MMHEISKSAWDRASIGVIIVNAVGRVEFLNRMADELLNGDYGLILSNGLISAEAPESAKILAERIHQATQHSIDRTSSSESAFRVSRMTGSMLMVLVAPLPPYSIGEVRLSEPRAMLMITDPHRERNLVGRHLVDWFGLTQAEAALAVQLAKGLKLASLAQTKRVCMSTLRSQLSSILAKTDTQRQSDLIRLLHQLPTTYRGDKTFGKPNKTWGGQAHHPQLRNDDRLTTLLRHPAIFRPILNRPESGSPSYDSAHALEPKPSLCHSLDVADSGCDYDDAELSLFSDFV